MKYLKLLEEYKTDHNNDEIVTIDLQYIDDLLARIKERTSFTNIEYHFSELKESLNIKLEKETGSIVSIEGLNKIEEYHKDFEKIIIELKRFTIFVEKMNLNVEVDLDEINKIWVVLSSKIIKNGPLDIENIGNIPINMKF